jgi:hypothetical protein
MLARTPLSPSARTPDISFDAGDNSEELIDLIPEASETGDDEADVDNTSDATSGSDEASNSGGASNSDEASDDDDNGGNSVDGDETDISEADEVNTCSYLIVPTL